MYASLRYRKMSWQHIWNIERAADLWSIPDPEIVRLAQQWKREGLQRVLDLGCGIGRHAILFAREGFDVYGSDHSNAAVTTCREKFASNELRGKFWCGGLEKIPYEDDYFDAIIAFNSIHHGNRKFMHRVAKQIFRALRTGGKCYITIPTDQNRMCGEGEEVEFNTFVSPGMLGGMHDADGERGILHHYSSEEEVTNLLSNFQINIKRE